MKAVDELGTDISDQESKTLEGYLGEPFDYVVTVCDEANEVCPTFPGARRRLHWSFEGPAQAIGTEQEHLRMFRSVRDEIKEHVQTELLPKDG